MNYDFDKIIDRSGSGDLKHEVLKARYGRDDLIPLWVADMDFETPSFILDAIKQCLEHPVFGYTIEPKDYWPTVCKWIADHYTSTTTTYKTSLSTRLAWHSTMAKSLILPKTLMRHCISNQVPVVALCD